MTATAISSPDPSPAADSRGTGPRSFSCASAAGCPAARGSASSCTIARSAQDRKQVYHLRHECYLRNASIDPIPGGAFSDRFDHEPNSFSFLAKSAADEALATVRITVVRPDLGWTDSPAQQVFDDHPALREMASQSFVEASRLCFGHQARRDAFVRLLGNMAALADLFEVAWLVACPRVEHAQVYQNLFGFCALAAPRRYFGVKFQTQLLGVRRGDLREHTRHAKPMLAAWNQALDQLRSNPSILTRSILNPPILNAAGSP
jgi:hypothetical protein